MARANGHKYALVYTPLPARFKEQQRRTTNGCLAIVYAAWLAALLNTGGLASEASGTTPDTS